MYHLRIDFGFWARQLLEFFTHTPIGIVLVVVFVVMAIGFRSRLNFLRRRDYSGDPDELKTFDEQAALESWKQENERDS
jgi:hypothetical protein